MRKRALVVGINDYEDCPLEGCINDAKCIAKLLSKNQDNTINFDVQLITKISSSNELKGMIKQCFSGDVDIALFYFSGHGSIDECENNAYLVTPDYTNEYPGVSISDIMNIVNKSTCKNKVIILDCCYSGYAGNNYNMAFDEDMALLYSGVTILSASGKEEFSVEDNETKQGVFTLLLAEALKGGAADILGNITLSGIYAYIDKSLGSWSQRPVFKTNVKGFFPIRTIKSQINIDTIHTLTKYFSHINENFQLDPSFEFTNSKEHQHKLIEPYANPDNVQIFKDLQQLESVGLVVPVEEEHMYFAAMNSKACKLTPLGKHYWNLVKKERL